MAGPIDLSTCRAVDAFFEEQLLPPDPHLAATQAAGEAAGLPPIGVSPLQGGLLHLLARAIGARRVLEVGTLAGYSTTWLARALPEGGRLVTLELDPLHAEVATANLARSGLADRVELRLGPALASLDALVAEAGEPFDFIFLDADKRSNPDYLERALLLAHRGTLIVVDNVVRGGSVADPTSREPDVVGSRQVLRDLGTEPRLLATALQTVGAKGYDGLAIALVTADG